MRRFRQCERIAFLFFLCFTVIAPVVIVSNRLRNFAFIGRREFIEELSNGKYVKDGKALNAVEQEADDGLQEPIGKTSHDLVQSENAANATKLLRGHDLVQSENFGNATKLLGSNGGGLNRKEELQLIQAERESLGSSKKEMYKQITIQEQNLTRSMQSKLDEKVNEIRDQLIRARAYLGFAPHGSTSHLVKELKLRIKELERAVGEATRDSKLSRSALQKMKAMEVTLGKASRLYPDCAAMAKKLRAMTYNTEERIRKQKNQSAYLLQLAARTTPKGLHCLAMRLTAEYFALPPEERKPSSQENVHDPDLYHYAVFSDNVLACAVVVNSTVSSAKEASKIVFHVVTDSLNLPAISMWFLLFPPGKATVQVQSIDNLEGLSANNLLALSKQTSSDPRYSSALNHLRFYLPAVFPILKKVVFFDHDVVVQQDLSTLWSINMGEKVNGVVNTCEENDASFRQMDLFVNFSDPFVLRNFDHNTCTWAFGMNLFDLEEWRRLDLTSIYHKYLQMDYGRPLLKAGTLPLGWLTFYNQTISLDKRWHRLSLGYDSTIERDEVEQAAVLHYDGLMKPWLDIGVARYKKYWSKHLDYSHPYLQQCNIHE